MFDNTSVIDARFFGFCFLRFRFFASLFVDDIVFGVVEPFELLLFAWSVAVFVCVENVFDALWMSGFNPFSELFDVDFLTGLFNFRRLAG